MNQLKYKDYQGSVEFDSERLVLRGKIQLITDLVTYESETAAGLQAEFEAAVDDYIETCAALRRPALKPFSGTFNIRIEPECHKALARIAAGDDRSLNAVAAEAIRAYVLERQSPTRKIEHTHKLVAEESVHKAITSATARLKWETIDVEVN